MTTRYVLSETGERFDSLDKAKQAAKEVGGSAIYEWVIG